MSSGFPYRPYQPGPIGRGDGEFNEAGDAAPPAFSIAPDVVVDAGSNVGSGSQVFYFLIGP